MADQTIDELNIRVAADSNSAANALENLIQKLERMQAPVAALTRSNNGLDKLSKTLEKLSTAAQAAQGLDNLDKVTNAVNALQALGTLNGAADVSSYVKAIKKLGDSRDSINAIAQFPDISPQVSSLISALRQFEGVQNLNINSLINSVGKLPELVSKINSMPAIDTSRITQLREMLSSFQGISDRNVVSFINALNKLPDVANRLQNIDLGRFRQQIERLVSSLEPLTRLLQQNSAELQAFAAVINATRVSGNAAQGVEGLNTALGNLRVGTLLNVATLRKLVDVLSDCFNISSQFIENLNLFRVTMEDSTDEAYAFAEAVNDALGVDVSDWIKYQGFFQSVAKGFGLTAQKADLMSKNLTQLSYDISSFYNLSVDTAYTKVQAGISGELEPLRRLGFALDQATLKQVAYNHGITQSFESMTQAQKAQIRYVAMIEQASNIGVLGDMSRTIDSASNNMRVLTARIQQLGRAVGNILLPILSAILPYLTAFVQILTEAAQYIANLFGYELPQFDFSGITAEYDDITDSANEATKATEKFKGSLAGVDQLNIIGSHTNSGSGTDEGVTDWDLNLPSYDFLNGVESRTKEIVDKMKRWIQELMPWIETIGVIVGSIALNNAVVDGTEKIVLALSKLKPLLPVIGKFTPFFTAVALSVSSFLLLNNAAKKLTTSTGNLANNITQFVAGLGLATVGIVGFIQAGHPLGAVVVALSAVAGAVSGAIQGTKELVKEAYTLTVFDDVGISIERVGELLSDYMSSLTKVDDKIIENNQKIESNNETIKTQIDTLTNLQDEFLYTGNMSEDMAMQIQNACESIKSAISENLSLETQNIIAGVGDSWQVVSEKARMAKDEIIGAFYAMNSQGNEVLATLNKRIADSTNVLSTAEKGSAEYTAAYNDYIDAMKQYTNIQAAQLGNDTDTMALRATLSGLTEGKIALMDKDTALTTLEKIGSEYDTSISKMLEAKTAAQSNLQTYKATMEAMGIAVDDAMFNGLMDGIESNYKSKITELNNTVGGVVGNIKENLTTKMSEAEVAAADKYYSTAGGYFDYIGQWWNAALWNEDVNANINQSFADQAGVTEITNAVAGIENNIAANETLYGAGTDIGSNIVAGMVEGVNGKAQDLNNSISWTADGAMETARRDFGINSPSKEFAEIGDFCMQGLINGFEEQRANLFVCIDGIALSVINRMAEIKQAFDFSDISSTTAQDLNSELAFRPKINSSGFSGRGYAREAVEDSVYNVTSAIQNSGEYTFNLHTTVDLDGDTVGESVTRYQNNLVYTSGGRN